MNPYEPPKTEPNTSKEPIWVSVTDAALLVLVFVLFPLTYLYFTIRPHLTSKVLDDSVAEEFLVTIVLYGQIAGWFVAGAYFFGDSVKLNEGFMSRKRVVEIEKIECLKAAKGAVF